MSVETPAQTPAPEGQIGAKMGKKKKLEEMIWDVLADAWYLWEKVYEDYYCDADPEINESLCQHLEEIKERLEKLEEMLP